MQKDRNTTALKEVSFLHITNVLIATFMNSMEMNTAFKKKKKEPGIRPFCWHLTQTTNELCQPGKMRTDFTKDLYEEKKPHSDVFRQFPTDEAS